MEIGALLDSIEKQYTDLTPQLRKAARFVTQEPTTVALSPLREVAKSAGVSPTTLIRLATTLKFKGYDDFREPFRESLRPGSARYSGAASQVVEQEGHKGFGALFQRTGQTLSTHLSEVFSSISVDDVEAAGQSLTRAKRLFVLGLRSCYAAAFYFRYASSTFKDNVHLIDGQKGMLVDDFIGIGEGDALLVMSFDPYPLETVKIVSYCLAQGATVVAITDARLSPIAQRVQHVLLVPASSSSFYTSLVPTFAMLEVLISYMLTKSGKRAVERIESRFAKLEQQGVYWNDRSEIE